MLASPRLPRSSAAAVALRRRRRAARMAATARAAAAAAAAATAAAPYANDVAERTFGAEAGGARVVLYRDQAAWCPYCQKVWILLEVRWRHALARSLARSLAPSLTHSLRSHHVGEAHPVRDAEGTKAH